MQFYVVRFDLPAVDSYGSTSRTTDTNNQASQEKGEQVLPRIYSLDLHYFDLHYLHNCRLTVRIVAIKATLK